MIEIVEDTKQKRAVESSIKSLELNIKSYSIAAEEKSDLSFLAKTNSFLHILRKKKEFQNLNVLNIQRNMKKSIVFCFCNFLQSFLQFFLVISLPQCLIQRMFFGLQKFVFEGQFSTYFPKTISTFHEGPERTLLFLDTVLVGSFYNSSQKLLLM